MRAIAKPGIYYDMPEQVYRADPCPSPSFTQSLAKLVLERSPLHAWWEHPRLNPHYQPDNDTKFDIGNIAHKLLIGRGKELVVLDEFDDWRTKAARERRENAALQGQLAVLGRHFMVAQAMARAAKDACENTGCPEAFDWGDGEVVIAWEENGLWLRSMIDWFPREVPISYDYKTTEMSVAPHVIGARVASGGWDIQAAMQERGLVALGLIKPGQGFRFVAQESEPPYVVTIVELTESIMTLGRKKVDAAIAIWRRCMKENRFPGYPSAVIAPEYPAWAEARWLDREQTEFYGTIQEAANILMAG